MQPQSRGRHLCFDWNRAALERFVFNNPQTPLDRDPGGRVRILLPPAQQHFHNHLTVHMLLWDWHLSNGNLGFVMDLGRQFFLSDGQVLCPDAAWVVNEKWQKLSDLHRRNIPPTSPDFVVEIRSPETTLGQQLQKVHSWLKNGASLVWLIDAFEKKQVIQFWPNEEPQVHHLARGPLILNEMLPGFSLDPQQLAY